jgi:hypothetical protein
MNDLATETAAVAITPKRKANGAAGPVQAKGAMTRFGTANTLGKDKSLLVKTEGGALPLVYNLRRVSLQDTLDLASLVDDERTLQERVSWQAEWLSRVIVSWDYFLNPGDEKDDRRYPLTKEELMKLNREFLGEVWQAIQEDANPPEPATPSSSFT